MTQKLEDQMKDTVEYSFDGYSVKLTRKYWGLEPSCDSYSSVDIGVMPLHNSPCHSTITLYNCSNEDLYKMSSLFKILADKHVAKEKAKKEQEKKAFLEKAAELGMKLVEEDKAHDIKWIVGDIKGVKTNEPQTT